VAACALELIINGVLGYLVVQEPGFGVPFRFLAFGLPMMGSDYFYQIAAGLAHLG